MIDLGLKRSTFLAGIALASAFSQPTIAQIYKYEDANGNVVYSDQPPPEAQAETVELGEINRAGPPPKAPSSVSPAKPANKAVFVTEITEPADGTTIPMGPGNFSVTAKASPSLGSAERLQLMIDGQPYGEPGKANHWGLTNVFRGEHKLTVNRVDRNGKVVDTSAPITVYVLRPSVR